MRLFGIGITGAIGLMIATADYAVAQDETPGYGRRETPLYTTGPQAELDKNFGLPSFGMPGAELPQQRTMATKTEPPREADFFAEGSDLTVPKNGRGTEVDAGMETPLYTTSQGVTGGFGTGDTTTSETTAPMFGTAGMAFGTRQTR